MDRVLSRFGFGRKADPPAPPIINDGAGNRPSVRVRYVSTLPGAYWSERSYEQLATQGYRYNADVYACVSLIAQAGKQVRWDTAPGSKSIASVELLERSGGASLIEAWLSYLLLSGNDYLELERIGSGISQVYLLQPDRVTAKPDLTAVRTNEQSLVQMWRVTNARGMPYPVPPDDMVHSKLFNPLDPIYGMAPLEAAMIRVDSENEGAALMKRMLQRGYSPGWIEAKENSIWEDTQVAQLKERIRDSKAKGEELFLENAAWHQMGFDPGNSGVSEQHVLTKRDIAAVFHVPSQLIGDTNSQTYSNFKEARLALYMEAVIPLLEQFVDDWNEVIGRDLKSPLAFDKDRFDAIAAARAEASDRVTKLWTSGLITQNEGRAELNYDEVPGGDVFYAPASFLPLGEGAAAAAEPPPPKPKASEPRVMITAEAIADAKRIQARGLELERGGLPAIEAGAQAWIEGGGDGS